MRKATVKMVDMPSNDARDIRIIIDAKDSVYISENIVSGLPFVINSGPLVDGINHVLEFGHTAVNAMKGNKDFELLAMENRALRRGIKESELAVRVRQLLSALDYDKLTDFQARCVLLVEQELK